MYVYTHQFNEILLLQLYALYCTDIDLFLTINKMQHIDIQSACMADYYSKQYDL